MTYAKLISTITGVALFAAAAVLWARPNPRPDSGYPIKVKKVTLSTVEKTSFHRSIRFPGITRSSRQAVVSFSVPGRIATTAVEVGRQVKGGDTLARLDDAQFRNALAAAEAKLAELEARTAQTRRDRARVTRLVAENAATAQQLEQIRTSHEALEAGTAAAQAQVTEARRQLRETCLTAPFDGTVTAVFADPGEWVAPGVPMAEISGAGRLELVIEIPETVVSKMSTGQAVAVSFPFADRPASDGTIVSVSAAASGRGRLFPVLIALPAGQGLAAGMTAEVDIDITLGDQMTVPLHAIINPGAAEPALFRVVDGQVQRMVVALGPMSDNRVAVNGDLAEGDQVVISGQTVLADGDLVETGTGLTNTEHDQTETGQ